MDKKLIGLVGAVALAPLSAQAMPAAANPDLKAASFAELLAPIPNATDKLAASDTLLQERDNVAKIEMAQYHYHHHHHHHFIRRSFHHHHHYDRRRFHHHHHHY